MNNIIILFYLILIVAPIGIIVHEIGHVVGAKIVKADKIYFSVGTGRRLICIVYQNIHLSLYALLFAGGHTSSERKRPYNKLEICCISILGPINNIFIALICYLLFDFNANRYVQLLVLFNLWLAFVNLIPFKWKTRQSDGYSILKAFTQG